MLVTQVIFFFLLFAISLLTSLVFGRYCSLWMQKSGLRRFESAVMSAVLSAATSFYLPIIFWYLTKAKEDSGEGSFPFVGMGLFTMAMSLILTPFVTLRNLPPPVRIPSSRRWVYLMALCYLLPTLFPIIRVIMQEYFR